MHRFLLCPSAGGKAPRKLNGAHLLGVDGVPVRGEVRLDGGVISCQGRNNEALALSLLWPVKDFGSVQLQTTRLPEREQPYHLHVELARHRLMRLSLKREEWGLYDYAGMEETVEQIDQACNLFIQAMQTVDDPPSAARLADKSLSLSMWASERMCRFHASVFLDRRQQSGGFKRGFLGVAAPPPAATKLPPRLKDVFDFVRVPFLWRNIQPEEQAIQYAACDALVKAGAKAGVAIHGGPLLNFGVQFIPDWMYIWENDYDAILEFVREHIRRTVQRYAGKIDTWVAASGLHAENVFPFNFEQLMNLTRAAVSTTRQAAPRSTVLLDLIQPWGEYYARNQRTVPPLLYAETAVQSGIQFDAFGLQFLFGLDSEGFRLRDLLQISSLIDRLANLGKPLHITAVGVPSKSSAGKSRTATGGGTWHGPWSDQTQADWLAAFVEIALSKPFVESVCMHAVTDTAASGIPSAGVYREDLTPKPTCAGLAEFRRSLKAGPKP